MILTPWGVPFHPVVVICLGKILLLKSVLGHCDRTLLQIEQGTLKEILYFALSYCSICLVLSGLGKNLLLKSVLGHCDRVLTR